MTGYFGGYWGNILLSSKNSTLAENPKIDIGLIIGDMRNSVPTMNAFNSYQRQIFSFAKVQNEALGNRLFRFSEAVGKFQLKHSMFSYSNIF